MKIGPRGHIQLQLFTLQWMVLWDSIGSQKTADSSRCLVKNDYKYEGWEKALRSCKSCLQVHRHDTEKKIKICLQVSKQKENLGLHAIAEMQGKH